MTGPISDPTDPVIQQGKGYEYWAADEDHAPDYDSLIMGSAEPRRKKRSRKTLRFILRYFTLFIVVIAAYLAFNLFTVYSQSKSRDVPLADAIAVLGAAQFNGHPSPVLAARLDHAITLYESGKPRPILTTGSKQDGDTYTEGFSGYTYLLEKGIDESDLILITDGADTYQQLSASALQLKQRSLRSVVLVSDSSHSARLRLIADELGMDAAISFRADTPTWKQYLRETAAVSLGRIVGFRRVSSWDLPG